MDNKTIEERENMPPAKSDRNDKIVFCILMLLILMIFYLNMCEGIKF